MDKEFSSRISATSALPLCWAGSTMEMDYLNFGDALSPVMVALVSGRSIRRVPTKSNALRMGAVGTIGHGFSGGEVWFWGTGCSNWKNPSAKAEERVPFTVPDKSRFVVAATRGPVSERLLAGPDGRKPGVYGDPVWLLPQFYRPTIKKKWKLGVILHLSELKDRSPVAVPHDGMRRFDIPAEFAADVHLITTCTPISMQSIGDKIDEILSCERIVSTSLHGIVIAESYGIPCLYFSPHGAAIGPEEKLLDPNGTLDLRFVDLYSGLGQDRMMSYVQPRTEKTDWAAVMAAIDAHWRPVTCDGDRLIDAFPLQPNLVQAQEGQTIWQHPVLTSIELQADVAALRRNDAKENPLAKDHSPVKPKDNTKASVEPPSVTPAVPPANSGFASVLRFFGFNRGDARIKEERLARIVGNSGSIPVSWAAGKDAAAPANLGDALSAVVIAALSGVPVRHAHFDAPIERLVGVGTIGHAQKNGRLHVWGTGFDATRNAVQPDLGRFVLPPETVFEVHATRGPRSAALLKAQGVPVEKVAYGDPVMLLPEIWPMDHVTKTHDVGVIVHITELETQEIASGPMAQYRRYQVPEGLGLSVRIINTLTPPTLDGLKAKVEEIAACRVILSTSLHGLVLAETYGIPCAWFRATGTGMGEMLDLSDDSLKIDHRMRDFYLGAGATRLPTFGLDRQHETDWAAARAFVQSAWKPLAYNAKPLIKSFPLPLAPRNAQGLWPVTEEVKAKLRLSHYSGA